jgi:hypothetical protein
MWRNSIVVKVSIVVMALSILSSGVGCVRTSAADQLSGQINVLLNESIGVIDPKVYGHFTEETLSSYEGGVSSEMLFNRKFEIPEERDINR